MNLSLLLDYNKKIDGTSALIEEGHKFSGVNSSGVNVCHLKEVVKVSSIAAEEV